MPWLFQPLLPGAAHQLSDPNAVSLTESASAGHSQGVTISYAIARTESVTAVDEATIPVPRSFFTADNASTDVRCIRHADDTTYVSSQAHPSGADYGAFVTDGAVAFLCGYGSGGSSDRLIDSLKCSTEVWTDEAITLASQRGQPAGASGPSHGIIIGGMDTASTRYTSVEKLTYASKTVGTHSGSLAIADAAMSGMQSATKGYVTKRYAGVAVGMRAFTFASDTAATLSYATANYGAAATSSTTAGYLWGGRNISDDTHWGYITRLDFATETDDTNHTYSSFNYQAGAGDAGRGYAVGGALSGTNTDMIAKCTYATGTYSLPSIYLGAARPPTAGIGYLNEAAPPQTASITESATPSNTQSGLSGYDTGNGYIAGGGIGYVKKFSFAAETLADTAANVGASTHRAGTRSATHGYFAGRTGVFGYGKKFQVSGETVSDVDMGVDRNCRAGLTSSTKGYYAGGDNSGALASVVAILFSDDTYSTISGTLDTAKTGTAQGVESSTSGFVAGSDAYSSAIETIVFSTEAVAAISATLNTGRQSAAAVKSSTAAYFVGGYTGSNSSEIDGITFSTEAATNPTAAISPANGFMVGVSSALRGYIMGYGNYTHKFHFPSETIENTANITGTIGNDASSISNSIPASSIQSADRTEGATAGHSNDSGVASSSSLTEAASATHANTVIGAFNPALVETASATHTNTVAATFTTVASEATAASHSNTGATTMPASSTEATSAAHTNSAENLLGATRGEAASGTDATNGIVTQEVSRTDGATGSDSHNSSLLMAVARTEAATVGDTNSALFAAVGAAVEAAAATAAQTSAAVFVSSSSEAASATTTQDSTAYYLYAVSVGEASSATESAAGTVAFSATTQQSAVASDAPSVFLSLVAAMSESAAPGDVHSAIATIPATRTEPANAADVVIASSGNSDWVIEAAGATHTDSAGVLTSASANEAASASELAAQGTAVTGSRAESASASDSASVIRLVVSSSSEDASANDARSASVVFSAAEIAAANATTSQSVIASISVASTEGAAAGESVSSIGVFLLTKTEVAVAVDTALSGIAIERAIIEAAVATAIQLGIKIGDERVYRVVARVLALGEASVISRTVRVSARASSEPVKSARATSDSGATRVLTVRNKTRFIMD